MVDSVGSENVNNNEMLRFERRIHFGFLIQPQHFSPKNALSLLLNTLTARTSLLVFLVFSVFVVAST
ncbi:hypothetical protein CHUAL_001057 [Chamberlinius hualienensis]